MARYLLESGAPDGYLLEDGTGVLLLEAVPTTGTLAVTLDDVVPAVSGTLGHSGTEAATLGDVSAALSGAIGHSGTEATTLGDVSSAASGVTGHAGTVAVTLGDIAFDASGTVQGAAALTGTLAATLDDVSQDASGVAGHSGDLALTLGDVSAEFSAPSDTQGGGVDYSDKKKRHIVRKDGQLLVFRRKEDALAFMALDDDPEPEEVKAPEPEKPKPEPERVVLIREVRRLAKVYDEKAAVRQMLDRAELEALIALFERLQDEEDIEMLMLAV